VSPTDVEDVGYGQGGSLALSRFDWRQGVLMLASGEAYRLDLMTGYPVEGIVTLAIKDLKVLPSGRTCCRNDAPQI
jgi:hypothetical protein